MKRICLLLASLFLSAVAFGQITPVLQPGQIVGNISAVQTYGYPISVLPFPNSQGVQMVASSTTGNISNMCGLPFVDGVNGTDLNYILLAHQTIATQNGPWQMHAGTCPGSGNWTRPNWFLSGSITQAVNNMSVLVAEGTLYAGTTWTLQFAPTPVIIDTTAESWFVANPEVVAANAGTIGRTADLRASDTANVLDYGKWSGTIRHSYGNSNAVAGISCTATSNTITLANVTIPTSYNGGGFEIPGCGNPGAENASNAGNEPQSFTFADAGTGYYGKQILAATGGTSTVPAWIIVYSTIMNATPTIASGGSGCTNGTQTFTGTTGLTGITTSSSPTNFFTVTGTVSGNALTSISSYTANGPYTENPAVMTAEPVSGGGCSVAPTLDVHLSFGANTGSVYASGNYTVIPGAPVPFTPAALPINPSNSAITWSSTGGGTVTVVVKTLAAGSASVLPEFFVPGWTSGSTTFPVTIAGVTPSGYNGTYTATVTGPASFTFPLASNPGSVSSANVGTYTVAPAATGADANLSWYGNPLVGTISGITNSGGLVTFTSSVAAGSTLTNGGGYVYVWNGTDDAAFTAALATGAQAIIIPSPPPVAGWESGYMIAGNVGTGGIQLGGIHRWAFDCQGSFISGAVNANSPNQFSLIQANGASAFRDQGGSTITRCDFDAAGGYGSDLELLDWDWEISDDYFKNATNTNIKWSFGGHSRESQLRHSWIVNDGYNPLTFPVMGINSAAFDTRVSDLPIVQGFQQTAINDASGTGDVNWTNLHVEQVVGGPSLVEQGAGNRWMGGNQEDVPPPGFPGFYLPGSYNLVNATDTNDGTIGIYVYSTHNIITNNRFNSGGTSTLTACIDSSNGGVGTTNIWGYNVGCASTQDNVLAYPRLNGVAPSLVGSTAITVSGTFPDQTITLTAPSGTTGTISGSVAAGACDTGTATVTGVTSSMALVASPSSTGGPGAGWSVSAYRSASNTATVQVCNGTGTTGSPTSSTYNVRAIP